MKELITIEQANTLMLAVMVLGPIIGLIYGAASKKLMRGLGWGFGIGIGNFILWKVYNAITDSLGLDTVKNLLVNLGLFIAVGVIGGLVPVLIARKRQTKADGATNSSGVSK